MPLSKYFRCFALLCVLSGVLFLPLQAFAQTSLSSVSSGGYFTQSWLTSLRGVINWLSVDTGGNTISPTGNMNLTGSIDLTGDLTFDGGGTAVSEILDQDNLSSDSSTALATQQSIKAYVDDQLGSSGLEIGNNVSGASGSSILYTDASGDLSEDTLLTWDETSNEIGIGISSPDTTLDVGGSGRLQGSSSSALTGSIDPGASTSVTGVSTSFLSQLIVGDEIGVTSVLTGSIDPTASTSVTGVDTAFTSEVSPGDRIIVSGETRTVVSVSSNTSLTVDTAFTDNSNDTSPDVTQIRTVTVLTSNNALTVDKAFYNLGNDASPDRIPAELIIKDSSGDVSFILQSEGNVGFGTSAPGYGILGVNKKFLTIFDSDGVGVEMVGDTDASGASAGEIHWVNTDNTSGNQGIAYIQALTEGTTSNKGGDIQFATKEDGTSGVPQERMRIADDGNVGIGTTDPSVELDVTGDIKASGHLIAGTMGTCNGANAGAIAYNTDSIFYGCNGSSWQALSNVPS